MKLFATEVFTPNQFPEYTYIERPKEDLEGKFKRALGTPNVIVSLSGSSGRRSRQGGRLREMILPTPDPHLRC